MAGVTARSTKRIAIAIAALIAVAGSLLLATLGTLTRLENDTVDARFALRGSRGAPRGIVILAFDDRSFSVLRHQWPFPRRWDARVIDTLDADGARAIAVDVQFTEPSDPADDNALFASVARAGHVVLATTEVARAGQTDVLGGSANLRAADATAAAANMPASGDGVIRRYPLQLLGLPSFAAATARAAGHPVAASSFDHDTALIDFRGPPGTVRTVSFADVMDGKVSPSVFAGKVVVIGATAPTLQDVHATSTTGDEPMAGVEVQANAIWTAMHGNPLQPAPGWLTPLAIILCGAVAPLVALRFSVLRSTLAAVATLAGYLLLAQVAFDAGAVLALTAPMLAAALGTLGMLIARYVAAAAERNAFSRLLEESQLELIQRLAQAVESRDAETGEHTFRIGLLAHGLALELGLAPSEARLIKHAAIAHDIGKIGIPDRILLKPGALDDDEREAMRRHTEIGSRLLAGSSSPLVQLAESIARTHHEWWDGSGYPDGLAGEQIPLAGRLCAVVDVYDALVSRRHYKPAWDAEEVLQLIERNRGTQFDPRIVDAFVRFAPRLGAELGESYARERAAARSVSGRAPAPGVGARKPPPPEATFAY
jgi:CHASE2 domain-containing sensor protein